MGSGALITYVVLCLMLIAAGAPGAAWGDTPVPTFAKDVAPIIYNNCVNCHRTGEAGPFPLQTYDDVRKRADLVAQMTDRRLMPPWKPVGHGLFRDDRRLSQKDITTLRKWVDGGTPAGDVKDLPPMPKFPEGWHLGPPDVVLEAAEPITIPAEGPDLYVHYVMPAKFDADRSLRAVQVLPSNRGVTHHGVPFIDTSGVAAGLARKHGHGWYPNFGGTGFLPRGILPGYAPGQTTRAIDPTDPRGLVLPKGSDVVLQMHYHPTGKVETDRPRIGLYFRDGKPKRNPSLLLLTNNSIDIAPGEKKHTLTDSFTLPVDFEVRDVFGHMHVLGRDLRAWAELPDGGRRDLLHIPDWDFSWQDSYRYTKPMVLPRGTVVKAEWTWDNSDANPRNPTTPAKRVFWGESSDDEMTAVIVGGMAVRPGDETALWIKALWHYLTTERTAHEFRDARKPAADKAKAAAQ